MVDRPQQRARPDPGPDVFIGVDGGASKTRAVALAADGRVLGQARGPAATLAGMAANAWAPILETIAKINTITGVDWAGRALVVGIAGTEISAALRAFVERAPGCAGVQVVSDAHTAWAGAFELADGAIVAVGTGVVGFCRDHGATARVGGWGFPHDDRGSGAWLGVKAVGHALAAADGRRAGDELADRIRQDFDRLEDLSAWASAATAGDFARYARLVVDQAAAGQPAADALLERAAAHVSAAARALTAPRADLGLALTGGLAAVIAPRLDADLRDRLQAPAHDGATGAALMARRAFQATVS